MVGMDLYRSDLRFRLRGMTIHVPPLRRRAEDIPLLAEHFTARYCQRHELPEQGADSRLLRDAGGLFVARQRARTAPHHRTGLRSSGDGTQLFTRHLPTEIPHRTGLQTACAPLRARGIRADPPLPEQEPSTQPRKPGNLPHPARHEGQSRTRLHRRAVRRLSGDVRRAAGIAGVSRGHFYELLKKIRAGQDVFHSGIPAI